MSNILRHPKLLSAADLSTFQCRIDSTKVIDVYFTYIGSLDKNEWPFVSCHTEVFNRYLQKFTPAKPDVKNNDTCLINAPYETVALFLTCLYAHYLGLIDDEGCFVDNHYALSLKHTPYLFNNLQELARFYDLKWLDAAYGRVMALHEAVAGPVYYHASHNELVIVGQNRLASTSAPVNLKALTSSPDGLVWYGICCFSGGPTSSSTEVWMKEAQNQHWLKLTEVNDPFHPLAKNWDICLSENVCLYVLFNGTRLQCYNLAARTWTKIPLPYTQISHVLSQTGDGSLPAAVVTNSRAGQVTLVTLTKQNWTQSAAAQESHLSHYTCETLSDVARVDEVKSWLELSTDNTAVEYYNQVVKHASSGDVDILFNPVNASLEQVVEALVATGRHVTTDYFINPAHGVALQTHQKRVEDQTAPADYTWLKVVTHNRRLCGLKSTGQWWQREVIGGPQKKTGGEWTLMFPQPLGEWAWNPQTQKLSDVNMSGGDQVCVDQVTLNVDLFNPNIVKQTLAKSRFIKHAVNPPKDPQNEIIPTPNNELTTPVMLFLLNLTKELMERVETEDVYYFNGGVEHLYEDDVRIFMLEPPRSFTFKRQTFVAILKRTLKPDPPVFMCMGYNVETTFNFGCISLFVDHKLNMYKYTKGCNCAVLTR
nr:ORF124 [Acipenserid herpesvirus 1]